MSDYLMHYGVGWDENPPGRGSGRYPHGSGENPNQHDDPFKHGCLRAAVKELREAGWTDKEIADRWGYTINELRDRMAIEKINTRNMKREKVLALSEAGKTNSEIARELGINESSVRALLDPILHEHNNRALSTAKMLKKEIDDNGMTDIGRGMANRLGISETALKTAVRYLEIDGYHVYNVPVSQNGTAKKTSIKVCAPPNMTWAQAAKNKEHINVVNNPYSEDGGRTWENIEPPMPISAKRVFVRYSEDGGDERDGLIEIRRGVKDLDIGKHNYAQVRIGVSQKDNPETYLDGTNYMKGVAVYSDNIPEGYDVVYNSNKKRDAPFDKVFKPYKTVDESISPNKEVMWDNPFGANIKANQYDDEGNIVREIGQKHYIDENGNRKLSSINIVNEAGDWEKWSKSLSSQFLSKQRTDLAERQLKLAYDKKKRELDEIMALENPEIKMKLLDTFADDCDSAAVELKAAALPKQQSHVIIPIPSLKDYEVYAPNYPDGSVVSLVRYPHGGIFEIPTLIVNNRNTEARKILGPNPPDAIGINHNVAAQLSGADFDGDTVIVLPNPNKNVIASKAGLKGLKDFETKIFTKTEDQVPTGPKSKTVNGRHCDGFNERREMGRISNLITDMTLHGAPEEELARAIKHSMVVIDAEKHNLDWKASEKEYNIAQLRARYQPNGGTGTLISSSKSKMTIPERADFRQSMVDKETGEIHWKYTNRFIKEFDPETKSYRVPDDKFMSELQQTLRDNDISIVKVNKYSIKTEPDDERVAQIISDFSKQFKKENGYSYKPATKQVTKMSEAKDAYSLSSGTKMEAKYANFANSMKALGNEARKIRVNLDSTRYSKDAREKYKSEVASILAKTNEAMKRKPLERKVQAMADVKIAMLKHEHPDISKQDLKKHRARMVREGRQRMGTQKYRPTLTDKEWAAVQAGALTSTQINNLFSLMDVDVVRQYATPKNYQTKLSAGEISYIKTLAESGNYTTDDIAKYLGVSTSTVKRVLYEE